MRACGDLRRRLCYSALQYAVALFEITNRAPGWHSAPPSIESGRFTAEVCLRRLTAGWAPANRWRSGPNLAANAITTGVWRFLALQKTRAGAESRDRARSGDVGDR